MRTKLDTYMEDFEEKKRKNIFMNPLYRIKLTHILATIVLTLSALFFTDNIVAISIQLLSAIIIVFHDMDDRYLKSALSEKIRDLQRSEDGLEKRVQEELSKNDEKNRELLELQYGLDAHAIVAKTDSDGNINYVNDKFIQVSGYAKEELIGKNHRILNSGYHSDTFWKKMYKTLKTGKPWRAQVCNKRKDGSLYWVDSTIIALHDAKQNIKGYIAIRTDITKQKKEEEELAEAKKIAEESAKAKSEFLASMSHEIRTPLNAILGFVTILKKEIHEEKSRNYLDIIDSSGKSLLTIINDILDFSKMQSGQFEIDRYEVQTLDEFNNSVMLFSSNAYEKHLIYSVFIDPNLPSIIKIDATRVKQILSNLLSNAIKFTPLYGQVKVSITYHNGSLKISVQDTGIGISVKNQKKLFVAFTQADSSTTRKFGGTGLGLSISYILAGLMEGKLYVTSEEGEGSTFTLELPIEVVDATPTQMVDSDEISQLKIAILNNCQECKESMNIVTNYLKSFGVASVVQLEKYQKDGYDVLIFSPDEEYNEAVIEAKIPAIATLRSTNVVLADFKHIAPLYAPFTMQNIIEALTDVGANVRKIEKSVVESETDEIEFEGNVLIAEDNKTNQMLIKLIMMDYGISFKIANDGVEAVILFKEGKYDMVLMDENMPNMNGLEALYQIREYEKKNKLLLTPIVALTANALESDRERFLEAGMDGFVAKPIDTKLLEKELGKYLKRV